MESTSKRQMAIPLKHPGVYPRMENSSLSWPHQHHAFAIVPVSTLAISRAVYTEYDPF
jgi:hypothetical protein